MASFALRQSQSEGDRPIDAQTVKAAEAPQIADDDLLLGGRAITNFVNAALGTAYDSKTVHGWLVTGKLPSGHFGGRRAASKTAIRRTLAVAAGLVA
jgi:hypothetical protein